MPFKNEISKQSNDVIPKELFFNEILHSPTGRKETSYTLGQVNCFGFSFIKISCATTIKIKIKITWTPTFSFSTYPNLDLLNNPAASGYYIDHESTVAKKVNLIVYPSEEVEIDINTYKMFVLPIQGEIVGLDIIPDASLTTHANNGVMIRCALSNNYHNVVND